MGGLSSPHGLAIDHVKGQIYWSDNIRFADTHQESTISRAALDGSSIEEVQRINFGFAMQSTARSLGLDLSTGRVYWADHTDFGHDGRISRSNLDGSTSELLLEYRYPDGLALDVVGGTMYWSDFVNGRILRSGLDGSLLEILISSRRILGLALD